MEAQTRPLTRDQIAEFAKSRRAQISYENLQGDMTLTAQIFSGAPFITTVADPNLGSERVLTGSDNVTVADGGAGAAVTLDLTDTGVVADTYGSASETISIVVDEKGRLAAVVAFDLNTDNITEGLVNLFFTVARARASVSGASGITYNSTTGVFTLNQAFARGLLSGVAGIDYDNSTGSIALDVIPGVAGTYAPPTSITVNDKGQITAIS